jgi:hypothetical protein
LSNDDTAEICLGQNNSCMEIKFRKLGKSDNLEVPNTNPIGNYLSFLKVRLPTPNGQGLLELLLSELDRAAESGMLDRLDPSAYIGLLVKFCHDNPENSEYRNCR